MKKIKKLSYWDEDSVYDLLDLIDIDDIQIVSEVVKLLLNIYSKKKCIMTEANKCVFISK